MDDKKVQCFGSLDICANVCDAKCHLYRKCVKAKKKLRSKFFDFDSLRRGAGVNVQDDNGYTPLHHACLRGHKEIVRLLLSVDASPCVVDKKGATPLHLAAWKGDVDIVAMLLNHNNPPVNVNHVTLDQETALLMAAQFGFVNVVAQLIAHGADVNIRNIKQESALDLAAQYGRLETVQHLLRVQPMLVQPYKYPNWKVRSFSSTPLHRASKNGHKEVVQVLLAAGIDPNIRTNSGTPLHDAACFGKASVVRILLAKGADLRALDGRGKTVEDLLADYSEEATRRVRRVIREYESMARNNYESEDDFPPFPVQDNSPTSYPHHLVMTAPETQKDINTSLTTSSSSLVTRNPSQSFVKKLASKCLSFKAKFNSAPNISNISESNVDIKSKSEVKSSNALHIGNSKFFKKLSKKEESGEINCNDEFDTISLDRVGVLNRDSTVNRSNRSCPGFKTSLPNISENNELSDSRESIPDAKVTADDKSDKVKVIEAVNPVAKQDIFEPRPHGNRKSVISNTSVESAHLVNECYESYEFSTHSAVVESKEIKQINTLLKPKPPPRNVPETVTTETIYENVYLEKNNTLPPKPAQRTHIPNKEIHVSSNKPTLYENIIIPVRKAPEPPKRTYFPQKSTESSPSVSRSSTLSSSSDSMIDETNLEDILLSEKSKSFRHGQKVLIRKESRSSINRTQSNASDYSDITEASAIENVDCSGDADDRALYLSMTGTLPSKKTDKTIKKKVLFRHKTFTNIEVDRNSINVKDLPKWSNEFLKETLAHYHIRGTGHCIYNAPTVQEFISIFNKDTLETGTVSTGSNKKRDSYFETAICFCRPKPPKFHSSAEDLLDITPKTEDTVTIDTAALKDKIEIVNTSFRCFCDSEQCFLHASKRESPIDLIVKFSAIKRSLSTPDITLGTLSLTRQSGGLTKNKSVPMNLEEPYAVVTLQDIIDRNKSKTCESFTYVEMSPHTSLSFTDRPYSIKDISDVISLKSTRSSIDSKSLSASDRLPLTKSTSEHSGHWSLQSCNSNITIKSDASYKTCLEESSSDDGSDGTLQSDEESSDAETIKSDVSTTKRPWKHSNSFRFGNVLIKRSDEAIDVIEEESSKLDTSSSKSESGVLIDSDSSSDCGDSGVPGSGSLASLEHGSGLVGVHSGSRRRWDEAEGTSEGDALSVSSAASSCAPMHLAHHYEHSKVSPTPPKKPPRRNLSVSPTHANSPSSGYSYELRSHARSQDDLDEIQGSKHYLKHGRSVDQYVDGKLSYMDYEENHNSPRAIPVPNPRPSLKTRTQPVAITAMYENVVIKEQNPRRKLRRNNFGPQSEDTIERVKKYSNQERSSLESLLDDQSMNSPSDCERYSDGPKIDIPLSPSHYEQPPTPDHPPPSAKQAERSIHERIRPLSQEYKRKSTLRDSQTETDISLLRAASAVSVASGATDRSGNTDNCVEEYVCDVPFAGLFKGSTTTLDGIGLRPTPAERPKTLRKLKSVYDASPTEPTNVNTNSSNGQVDRSFNGTEEEVRRRSNTTSSSHSGDKSLSILSPFDEQEEWAKISEIMASFGSKLVRESVFVSELEQEFTNRLGLSCSESSLSPSVASSLGLWLSGLGLHDYEPLFIDSGYDDIEFVNGILDENDLREMGIEENDRQKILESSKQLPLKITEISNNHNNNVIKNQYGSVDEWLRNINLEQYSETFRKHLYVDMDRVRRIWEVELTAVLEINKPGHRKRILCSVSGEHNGPANNIEDINADLNNLLKDEIKEKMPPSENLKPVPPPVVPTLAPPGGETLKRSKKNRPAPQPPRPSDLEIRAPSELLVGVPGALKTQWKHQPFVLVTGAVTYVANYLGSTVVKELRGTESTKKSIQKLKKTTKEPRDSPDIILSISYRGVKFLNTITRELVCEHEIRNIHCACQDADDLTHFAYITKDHTTKSHYCHVFRVATMDQATEVILTLGEAFEVAYQMALREQANRSKVTQSITKTPQHEVKEKPYHGRSHSITEIKLNGHQLKIAPIAASLSNEDFQKDGSKSPRTPLLKAPIASTEEL
ncbi:ankyrin repeat and sterile alpha motif domain-containing protein 1B-like isoform X2 [Pieris brassicae]|uniref:ankyrin repeat and sterile alpha motif domain-containing protein 1B-like isoform X2 n=1 Tax=Pieris brassicae TaxID=7116 RepID=UPI001E6606FE|nr:ankyrin repeat and sterile alpha motif domain-containing protein 1B-like isoform X2 [Pieris brassicae]